MGFDFQGVLDWLKFDRSYYMLNILTKCGMQPAGIELIAVSMYDVNRFIGNLISNLVPLEINS